MHFVIKDAFLGNAKLVGQSISCFCREFKFDSQQPLDIQESSLMPVPGNLTPS